MYQQNELHDLYTEGYGAALVPVVVLEGLPARSLLGVLHDDLRHDQSLGPELGLGQESV